MSKKKTLFSNFLIKKKSAWNSYITFLSFQNLMNTFNG